MFGHATQESSPADEGSAIDENDLADWYLDMQEKFPEQYPPNANSTPYGIDNRRHPVGTKLMTYQDDDPAKSMRCTVRGSRWIVEYGDRSPVYVVQFRGIDQLGQIELLSAHRTDGGKGERWCVGWDVPPPAPAAMAKPVANINGAKGDIKAAKAKPVANVNGAKGET